MGQNMITLTIYRDHLGGRGGVSKGPKYDPAILEWPLMLSVQKLPAPWYIGVPRQWCLVMLPLARHWGLDTHG